MFLKLIYKNKLFIKYVIVGGTGAIVDFAVLYFLTDFFQIYYLISATISFILSGTLNYYLNRKWTFRSKGKKRRQLPVFFIIALIGLSINNFIMYVLVEKFAFWYIYAKIVATGVVLIWNFTGNKYITFNKKHEINENFNIG